MNALAESIGHWLADYYLLSTVLLAVVLAAMWAMRQPVRKIALTRATVWGLLLLAVLCALPDWSPVHLTEPVATAPPREVATSPAAPVASEPTPVSPSAPTVVRETIEPEATTAIDTRQEAVAEPVNFAVVFGGVFLVGSVLLATWFALGMWHLGRICRESERAPARVVSLFEKIAGAVPLLPRVLLNGRLPSAVALGAWDTSILLPKKLAEGDDEELGSVIAHEWAHVRNGDLRLLAASRLLLLLLWAHPLYWMLRVRMRLEQETLADAAAAEMTSRHDYAAQLVDWAKNMPAAPHRSLASAVGFWEGPSQLRRRVAVLLDEKLTVLRSCSRRWRWMAGAMCALIAVGLSLVTLRPGAAVAEVAERGDGDVYEKVLGLWEVVSVEGSAGRFMDINDKTKPGDQLGIPHVRVPGPDFDGSDKVYAKSPFVTRWATPQAEKEWKRDDSLYLYPEASPGRCTYKGEDGKRPHFSDESNPPEFAIYRFEGDQLTLMIGDPADFEIKKGQEVNESSAGTPVDWKWKFVVPNYPEDFKLDPGERQLRVTLKRVERLAATVVATEASASGGSTKNAVLDAVTKESAELRGKGLSVEARQAKYRDWLRRLKAELERTKDPAVRSSLSRRALGYANSLGEYRTSESLLLELIELDPRRAADWAAELGGVYEMMGLRGLAKDRNLKRSRDAFALAIEKCDSAEPSPQSYYRLIMTLADRGKVCDKLYESTRDRQDLKDAAADYRRGGEELKRMSELATAKPENDWESGHGGYVQNYRNNLDKIVRLRYDADWFAQKELLVCGRLNDDARAGELLPMLMASPGSDVDRDRWVLEYAKQRYGITSYPKFVEFWEERAAVEKTAVAFFKASRQLDFPAAAKLMAEGSPMAEIEQRVFEEQAAQLNGIYAKDPARLATVGDTFVGGDWAAVRCLPPIDHPQHCMFAALKKVDGEWKLYDGDDYRFQKPLKAALEELKEGR